MIRQLPLLLAAAALLCSTLVSAARAVPITGGQGPGGVESVASSNLPMWFEADKITGFADSTALPAWVNSGSGNNATAASGQQPTYRTGVAGFNGLPSVEFTGTNHRMGSANVTLGGDVTLFAVFQSTGSGLGQLVNTNALGSGGGNYLIERDDADALTGRVFVGSSTSSVSTSLVNDVTHVASYTFQNNATGGAELFLNGTSAGTANTANVNSATSTAFLGNHPTLERVFGGHIAEVVVMNRLVNSAERILIENYLASKYDLAIGSNRYDGDTADNGDYDFDVFGIGRVDAANFHLNGGAAGFGIQANSLQDNQWVLAGHDGTAHGVESFEQGNLSGDRWSRAWYVDVTGDADVTLGFDFTDAGLASEFDAGSTFQLLFSPTNDFQWTALSVVGVSDGSGLVTFAVPAGLLGDGYYTLGINVALVPEPSTLLLAGLGAIVVVSRRRRRGR